ncbi:hypothetical protein [Flavobacterium sp. LAR06]|uniref:hypothetical protein n=1 Tax=Flavobacterium sp. LAR06 TaxID=3064897 RepID=UPI0035C13EFE
MKKSISTQEDIKQLIIDIEQKWQVDKWIIDDIHVWPYIRIKIYIYFLNKLFSSSTENNVAKNKAVTGSVLVKYFAKCIKLVSAFFTVISFFLKLQNKKIIFFGAHYHRILHKGEFFNRFYDSMIDSHNLKEDVYMIEYRKVYEKNYNNKAIINLDKYLGCYKLIMSLMNKSSRKKSVFNLEGYDEFYETLNIKTLSIDKVSLLKWSKKIITLEGFYNRFYKKVKPEKVVFLGYYGLEDLTAAIVFARKLNIKTIDLQHGTQINNMAFSNWTKIPQNGFNTVVNEFWTWDEESKKNIEEWGNKNNIAKAKVIGQPYVSYWTHLHSKVVSTNKKILYTLHLSRIEEMVNKDFISIIKKLNYQWVLRLHPRNSMSINEIEEYLFANGIKDKVTVQSSVEMPLPEILSQSALHLTNYSGCLIEARMMNIPTVIINKLGLEIYKQYLDNKLVYFVDFEEPNFNLVFENLVKDVEINKVTSAKLEIYNPLS